MMVTLLFFLASLSYCVYRQEAYKIFDKFTMTDLVNIFLNIVVCIVFKTTKLQAM